MDRFINTAVDILGIGSNSRYPPESNPQTTLPSQTQVGGTHYRHFKIQPAEFCYINNIPYLEATAIKYLCRWKDKGGVQDLQKAKHFIDLLMEFEDAYTSRDQREDS